MTFLNGDFAIYVCNMHQEVSEQTVGGQCGWDYCHGNKVKRDFNLSPSGYQSFHTHFPAEVLQMLCYRSKSSGSSASKAIGLWWQSSIRIWRPFSLSTLAGFSPLSQLEPMMLAFSIGCDQRPRWAEAQWGVKDLLTSCERQATGAARSQRVMRKGLGLCVFVWVCGCSGSNTDSQTEQNSSHWASVIRHMIPHGDLINICQHAHAHACRHDKMSLRLLGIQGWLKSCLLLSG